MLALLFCYSLSHLLLYFYIKSGYLYCRMNNGSEKETTTTGIKLDKESFNSKLQVSNSQDVNYLIATWKKKSEEVKSFDAVKAIIKSKSEYIQISELVRKYILSRPKLSYGSMEKYHGFISVIKSFRDVPIDTINNEFGILFYNHCLKTMKESSAAQRLKQLKMFLKYANEIDLLNKTPIKFSPKVKKKEIVYLTSSELKILKEKDLHARLDVIRDIFLFQCYTGMEYSRVATLKPEMIKDGFIYTVRKKTGKQARVFLSNSAKELINKYAGSEFCFPVRSNVKSNAYLKEIQDICGFDKVLHTHLARHTFATLLLSKGVSVEVAASQMGISVGMMMKRYGVIREDRVASEMKDIDF